MTRSLQLDVTEPITSGDHWLLSSFQYADSKAVPRHVIEDLKQPHVFIEAIKNDMIRAFEFWLDPLPMVKQYRTTPRFASYLSPHNEMMTFQYRAHGYFDLGDEEETEALMALVNRQQNYERHPLVMMITPPPPLTGPDYSAAFLDEVADVSLLEPGTADNNINPHRVL
jgi:hypothetical protein